MPNFVPWCIDEASAAALPNKIGGYLGQLPTGGTLVDQSGNPVGGGGGSGTVNSGFVHQLAYYAAGGTAVSGLATANNGVLVTSAGGVPSISSTLPSGITLVAPVLGTPASGNLANCTFPTLNQNTTGSSGSCTGNAATVTTNANLTGDVTSVGNATTIAANAVSYAKMQQTSAGAVLLGNPTGSAGAPSEITLGTNLSFSGSVLNATGGGGMAIGNAVGSAGNWGTLITDGSANLSEVAPTSPGDIFFSGGASATPYFASPISIVGVGTLVAGVWNANPIGLAYIASGGASTGQVLQWNGGAWAPGSPISIGEAVGAGTSGSVLYVDAGGGLAQDNAAFNWNDTIQKLAISSNFNNPAVLVQNTYGTDTSTAMLCQQQIAGQFSTSTMGVILCTTGLAAQFTDGTRTVNICDGTNNITYTIGTPGNWTGTPPTDVWPALDRLAAACVAAGQTP
jgi:hypothetical protein